MQEHSKEKIKSSNKSKNQGHNSNPELNKKWENHNKIYFLNVKNQTAL